MGFIKKMNISLESEFSGYGMKVSLEEALEAEAGMADDAAEASTLNDEADRATKIADELEVQDEVLQNVVEQAEANGEEVPESTLALAEAARRAAATGLGLDPDEGAGAEVVDEAGLESIHSNARVGLESLRTRLSLEADDDKKEGIILKIKNWIKKIFKAIWDKIKSFGKWLMKVTNFMNDEAKQVYKALGEMKDDDFKAKTKDMTIPASCLGTDGKLIDAQVALNALSAYEQGWFSKSVAWIASIPSKINSKIGDKAAVAASEANAAKKQLVADFRASLDKKEIQIPGGKVTTVVMSGTTEDSVQYFVIEKTSEGSTFEKAGVSKSDLMKCVNVGKTFNKRMDAAEKGTKNATDKAEGEVDKAKDGAEATAQQAAVQEQSKFATALLASQRDLFTGYKAQISLAKKIVGNSEAKKD